MTDVVTRLATAQDLPDVLKMVHALAVHHDDTATVTLSELEREVLGEAPWITVIIACDPENLLGYAALCPLAQLQFGARGMDMHHLFVEPDARGQGIGRGLIKASIDHVNLLGCRYIMVGTHPENIPAQEIYRAAGFSQIPAPGPRFRIKFDDV